MSTEAQRVTGQPPAASTPAAAPPAAPNPGPPPPLNPNVIDEAVGRGVDFLRAAQKPSGIWGDGDGKKVGSDGGWAVGYTALAGLALIESGAPLTDPAVTHAAYVVRAGAPHLIDTYEVALAILFLDRMKDSKKDDRLIQTLAARLMAGQAATGGWGYKLPKYLDADAKKILDALRKLTPPAPPAAVSFRERPSPLGLCIKSADDFTPAHTTRAALDEDEAESARAALYKGLPATLKPAAVFKNFSTLAQADPKEKRNELFNPTTDNSNTHFATIGLWAARRHDVPTERSFALLARHFRTSHGGDGWNYDYLKGGSGSAPAMTCIGLLGLAIGNALGVDPGAPRVDKDPVIIKSLTMLSKRVGAPTGQIRDRPTPKEVGGLYYLWALERIGVLYDIKTLDAKDWYQWGAEILICHQKPDGSWVDAMTHGDHAVVDTALAILFLRRANLTQDLSKRLIVDTSVLTAKVSDTPPKKEPTPPKIAVSTPIPAPKPEPEPAPKAAVAETKPVLPTVAAVAEAPAPKKEAGTSVWVWVVGIVGVLLMAAAGIGFVLLRKQPEEKPKKKGKKQVAAAKAARSKARNDEEEEENE